MADKTLKEALKERVDPVVDKLADRIEKLSIDRDEAIDLGTKAISIFGKAVDSVADDGKLDWPELFDIVNDARAWGRAWRVARSTPLPKK